MESLHDTDQRLTALEIKASYSEDLLEQLNLVIYRQQQQIDALVHELQQMRQQQSSSNTGAPRIISAAKIRERSGCSKEKTILR